jgi:hypothetical protein
MNFNSLTTQDLIAIGSLCTAIFAFGATFWQAKIARDHNRKSTTPLLTFHGDYREGTNILVRNHGVGPAIIRQFCYYFNGQRCNSIQEFDKNFVLPSNVKLFRAAFTPPASLGVGNQIEIFTVHTTDLYLDHVAPMIRRVGIQIFYESVYGEQYTTEIYCPVPPEIN